MATTDFAQCLVFVAVIEEKKMKKPKRAFRKKVYFIEIAVGDNDQLFDTVLVVDDSIVAAMRKAEDYFEMQGNEKVHAIAGSQFKCDLID